MPINTAKTVMVLGAGRGQVGLYKAIRNLGHRSVAASIAGEYPGFQYADEIAIVDISDPEAVLAAAKEQHADAVVTSCMDTAMQSLGRVVDTLGLPGPSEASSRLCFDKRALKETLSDHDVPSARYRVIGSPSELVGIADEFGLPLVLKLSHSQGSAGVFICETLCNACEKAEEILAEEGFCLVEEYLGGIEFGAQAIVSNGDVVFIQTHGDLMTGGANPKPYIHYYPFEHQDLVNEAVCLGRKAIAACGFDNCAVNIDYRGGAEGLCILELTGRAGANGLPELTGELLGVDYYELIVRIALGEAIGDIAPSRRKALASEMVYADGYRCNGYSPIRCIDPNIRSTILFASARTEDAGQCIGQIVAAGNALSDCTSALAAERERLIERLSSL